MLIRLIATIGVLAFPLVAGATEYRTVEHPRQECWNEQVQVQSAGAGYGGTIIGGLAGGLLGNQVGGGNGRTLATAVGAVTGAVVGDRMASGYPSYRTVQRCKTVIDHEQVPVYREPVQLIRQPVQVYQEPVRVIRQPVQVYQEPVRIIRQPVVVEEQGYYIEPDERYYRHKHWKHNRHEHDDDDDD